MRKRIFFIIIILSLVLSGCSGKFSSDDKSGIISNEDTVFVIGYNFEGANPLHVKNSTNREIFSLIYDPLYVIDSSFMPYEKLAKGVTMLTSDGLNYKIELKDNVVFHNGDKLLASDVVATINYLLSNNTAYDYNVKNISNVSVNDDYSLNLTLKAPTPYIEALLTFPILSAKDILKGDFFNGTGMFKVDSYVDKKYIDLSVFSKYYDNKNEEIKRIKVQLMPDKETANYAYRSGMADIYSFDIFETAEFTNPKSGVEAKEFLTNNYTFMLMNLDSPVFKNVNVRKAIDMAIDKESIVEDVLFSYGETVSTPVFKNAWCYNKNIKPTYNVEEAKKILSKEGYTPDVNTGVLSKDENKLSFSILVNNDNNFRIQVANKISENLKYIGIDCLVKIVSFEEYANTYYEKTYEAFLGTVPMSYDFDLSLFLGEGNVSNYKSIKGVELINKLSLTDNKEEKQKYYIELQKLCYYDVPHISLYYTKETIRSSSKIKSGLEPTSMSIFNNIDGWSFK